MERMPSHGPARGAAGDLDHPPADLPDVAEAVTGRARHLHHLADALSRDADPSGTGNPAVALLRAHAGAVGDLARHLRSAGAPESPEDDAAAPPTPPSATPRTAP